MSAAEGLFTFSNYYHDHMVLQKSSTGTTIWGHSSKVGDVVHIKMNNNEVFQAVVQNNQIWEAKFTSPSDHGPYVISAVSSLGPFRFPTFSLEMFGFVQDKVIWSLIQIR